MKSLGITKACFEDQAQLDDWEIFDQATWRIEGRVLICEGLGGLGGTIVPEKDKGQQAQRMELKDIVFSDGTFEFKIQFMKGKYHEGGIFYRWQDVANWHNTHLQEIPGSVISVLIHLQ